MEHDRRVEQYSGEQLLASQLAGAEGLSWLPGHPHPLHTESPLSQGIPLARKPSHRHTGTHPIGRVDDALEAGVLPEGAPQLRRPLLAALAGAAGAPLPLQGDLGGKLVALVLLRVCRRGGGDVARREPGEAEGRRQPLRQLLRRARPPALPPA